MNRNLKKKVTCANWQTQRERESKKEWIQAGTHKIHQERTPGSLVKPKQTGRRWPNKEFEKVGMTVRRSSAYSGRIMI